MNENLIMYFKNSNAKEFAKYFGPSVHLRILNEEGYYSKYQSELIIEEFFKRDKPIEVKQLQNNISQKNNQYLIYQYQTMSKKHRIFLKLSSVDVGMLITEIRIE